MEREHVDFLLEDVPPNRGIKDGICHLSPWGLDSWAIPNKHSIDIGLLDQDGYHAFLPFYVLNN